MSTPTPTVTRDDVEKVKADWIIWGSYDLDQIEGSEWDPYREELFQFQENIKACNHYGYWDLVHALCHIIKNRTRTGLIKAITEITDVAPFYIRNDQKTTPRTCNLVYYKKDEDPISDAMIEIARRAIDKELTNNDSSLNL